MEITCIQMDVLISFYLENELSETLRKKVEEHLKVCPNCRAKYNVISSLIENMSSAVTNENSLKDSANSESFRAFKNNLSAYIDNELSEHESVKLKKYTINNKQARKELEDAYNIRRLMKNSFQTTKSQSKNDFSKKILKKLHPQNNMSFIFNPLIKMAWAFVMTVLTLSAIIIFSLSFG